MITDTMEENNYFDYSLQFNPDSPIRISSGIDANNNFIIF
jgi:hypothetical protein